MEVGSLLASALSAAFSVPCLVLLLVLGSAALRGGHGRPTRSAFLGYRTAHPGSSSSSHYYYSTLLLDDDDDEPPPSLLPAESCDRLPRAVFRRRRRGDDQPDEEFCAFCLSAVRDGDETRALRCRHAFHRACIDAWLVRRPRATCPLCRDRLLPDDDDDDDGDGRLLATASSSPASAYAHGGALWPHMT